MTFDGHARERQAGTAALPRREFLRRASMATVATAAAGGLPAGMWHALAGAARDVPGLDDGGVVAHLTPTSTGIVAVGERSGVPAVWAHRFGRRSWAMRAGGSAFPVGTTLDAVTEFRRHLYAAGSITRVVDTHSVISGRKRVAVKVHETTPAVFSSRDGSHWQQVVRGVPGSPFGFLNAITTALGGLLAVGSEFLEPDVGEPSGLTAVWSGDGHRWDRMALEGVVPPRHGEISLLVRDRGDHLLGTTGVDGTELYLLTITESRWAPLPTPDSEGRVTFTAAGAVSGGFLLAGIDDGAHAHFWRGGKGGWRRVGSPKGVSSEATVLDFQRIGRDLVAAGYSSTGGFVTEVEG